MSGQAPAAKPPRMSVDAVLYRRTAGPVPPSKPLQELLEAPRAGREDWLMRPLQEPSGALVGALVADVPPPGRR